MNFAFFLQKLIEPPAACDRKYFARLTLKADKDAQAREMKLTPNAISTFI